MGWRGGGEFSQPALSWEVLLCPSIMTDSLDWYYHLGLAVIIAHNETYISLIPSGFLGFHWRVRNFSDGPASLCHIKAFVSCSFQHEICFLCFTYLMFLAMTCKVSFLVLFGVP